MASLSDAIMVPGGRQTPVDVSPSPTFDGAQRGYRARDPEGNLWSFGIDRPG